MVYCDFSSPHSHQVEIKFEAGKTDIKVFDEVMGGMDEKLKKRILSKLKDIKDFQHVYLEKKDGKLTGVYFNECDFLAFDNFNGKQLSNEDDIVGLTLGSNTKFADKSTKKTK